MQQNICDECLGDLDPKQLSTMLLSLTNINKYVSGIPEIVGGAILEAAKSLMFSADFEYTYAGDPMTTKPTGRRFVGLRIEPSDN